ncbi:cisplatin damage response ATP-dependent DNA ligase [Novosphingobium sp.]|uniref:cisplatin damage response ATP-dependent DNA ligase n=1 Tax=Novosphingobium sp. TaxID=1874826 RepID=UPI0033408057
MQRFAALLDTLLLTRSRNGKLAAIVRHLRDVPDPDRGWALAALTGGVDFPSIKAGVVRTLMAQRVDPVLWTLSRDYVGDTAETASLLWPEPANPRGSPPLLAEVVDLLAGATRANAAAVLADLLDRLDSDGRYALLKFATGALRIGVSARLAKLAFAQGFDVPVDLVEEYWHGQAPPYAPLFAWATQGAPAPSSDRVPLFRPFMLAHPLEADRLDLDEYAAEWKWDGIRVQLVHVAGQTRLFSRGGDDISAAFPDMTAALGVPAVIDGELLVRGDAQGADIGGGGAASFNALQQRLGRKTVSARMLTESPAFLRCYDLLNLDGEDLRPLPWQDRRARLESFVPVLDPARFDLSALIVAEDWDALAQLRDGARDAAIEGIMFKHRQAPYVAGRRTGLWYKWKRDALHVDCVLMYAQRGSGKRSSFYSDFTFGCWTGDPDAGGELVPVGKAYFGFTDAELKMLDRHVRQHTVAKFGPVRETDKSLVFEVAFDSVHASRRHKSGVAMRFPRIARIRTDKPAHEADRLETLQAMIVD